MSQNIYYRFLFSLKSYCIVYIKYNLAAQAPKWNFVDTTSEKILANWTVRLWLALIACKSTRFLFANIH